MASPAEAGRRGRLRVRTVELSRSLSGTKGFPADGPPEVAFLGRSNVGKSSLLNRLVGRRSLARVSRTPGRTRLANYYLVNGDLFLVDLPGYGYARVAAEVRGAWDAMMRRCLDRRGRIALAVHIVDARRPATPLDREAASFLAEAGLPTVIAVTKLDKIKAGERRRALRAAGADLPAGPDVVRLGCSARTGLGVRDLWAAIDGAVARHRAAPHGDGR